jgi:phosphate transport system substrate-binding protein
MKTVSSARVNRWIVRRTVRVAVATLLVAAVVPLRAHAAYADASIDGAGSTWSQIAIDQWRADVARQGLSINYQGVGSTSGRVFYYQDQTDFGVSEIPFTPAYRDISGSVITDEVSLASHRPYAYLPIVAGGTSFMYHLDVNGQRYTDLRLSPETLAKIFTRDITNWNDPAVAADNPQLHIPSLPIHIVVRSDGSGTTAQFTAYLASKATALWNTFCRRSGLNVDPCPSVSLWPDINTPSQQFSDGVADYVAAPYNNGAITYVEYGYALQRGYPVASILNRAGYYTQPTAHDVAIALQGATINADGTQNLQGVYDFRDARAYPVSSYSYMIVPTSTATPFNANKGITLSKFILYFLCVGQQKAEQLGYSPLPRNLVQVAFDALQRIPGHVAPPPIAQCDNPTITGSFVTGNAPPPPASTRQGAPPPTTQTNLGPQTPGQSTIGGSGGRSGARSTTPTSLRQAAAGAKRDAKASGDKTLAGVDGGLAAARQQITAPPARDPLPLLLYVVAAIFAVLAVFGPPAFALALKRRRPDAITSRSADAHQLL